MARKKGSRNTLIRINYDDIGRLAGIAGDTARQYAQRGKFNQHSIQSVICWINERRLRRGQRPIGMPTLESEGGCSHVRE